MIPASSNSLTVRYTVEIEILSSTVTQRRYNPSTSGWSTASASTRAMTRRCSVMRMPVAAQRASMPVALVAGEDLSTVIGCLPGWLIVISMLRQVPSHQKCVQLFPVRLLIVAFAVADHHESGAIVEPPRRLVIFLNLQKYGADAAAGEMAEMGQKQRVREAAAAIGRIDGNGEDF